MIERPSPTAARRCRAAVLALMSAACAACGDARIPVELPELPGAHTVFLTAEHAGVSSAWVIDLAASPPAALPPVFREEATVSLAIAAYAQTPEQFGVTAGALPVNPGLTPLDARGATIFATDVDDDFHGWSRLDALPASLAALRVPGTIDPCARFTPTPHGMLGAISAGGVLLPLDATSALGSLRSGPFFRIRQAGVTALPTLDGLPAAVGYKQRDDTLWLFGTAGRVASGTVERGFVERTAAPTPNEFVALTEVPGSTRAVDLFVLSDHGDLFRYDGDRWLRLGDAQTEMTASRAVAAASATDVVFTSGTALLHLWKGGAVTDVRAVDAEVREVEALSYVPELGYVFGTTFDGQFYQRDVDGRTTRLLGTGDQPRTLGLSVDGILPFEGGFFASGGLGATLQWVPGYDFCPAAPPVAANAVTHVIAMGRDLVMLTETDDGIEPTAIWMARK